MFCENYSVHKARENEESRAMYLTREVWTRIRDSDVYRPDYTSFRNMTVGPFDKELYEKYPLKLCDGNISECELHS